MCIPTSNNHCTHTHGRPQGAATERLKSYVTKFRRLNSNRSMQLTLSPGGCIRHRQPAARMLTHRSISVARWQRTGHPGGPAGSSVSMPTFVTIAFARKPGARAPQVADGAHIVQSLTYSAVLHVCMHMAQFGCVHSDAQARRVKECRSEER